MFYELIQKIRTVFGPTYLDQTLVIKFTNGCRFRDKKFEDVNRELKTCIMARKFESLERLKDECMMTAVDPYFQRGILKRYTLFKEVYQTS